MKRARRLGLSIYMLSYLASIVAKRPTASDLHDRRYHLDPPSPFEGTQAPCPISASRHVEKLVQPRGDAIGVEPEAINRSL